MSKMGRIAEFLDSICDDDEEYVKCCKELHDYWNNKGTKLEDLSKKSFTTIMQWEEESGKEHEINKECVNEWHTILMRRIR